MNFPASSREKPNVVCVRSFVPKEKNSATRAISSATSAARGTSIMVDKIIELYFLVFHHLGRDAPDYGILMLKLLHIPDERDHHLRYDFDSSPPHGRRRFKDRARLH